MPKTELLINCPRHTHSYFEKKGIAFYDTELKDEKGNKIVRCYTCPFSTCDGTCKVSPEYDM